MILAIASVLAFYLGLLNTFLARFAGTCTQGDADRLWGILISVPFFLLAVFCLARTKHPGGAMIVCLPGLILLLWQGAFAVELSIGVLVHDFSACQVLQHMPQEYSGHEVTFAVLWPAVILGTLGAIAIVYFVRRSRAPTTPRFQS